MSNKKIIGLLSGVFDIVHPEHIEHFQRAKEKCDWLIVSLVSDRYVNKGVNRPYFKLEERKNVLESIKYIDEIVINDNDSVVPIIEQYKPDIYFKGKQEPDTNKKLNDEIEAVKKYGGTFCYTHDSFKYSTSAILNNRKNNPTQESYKSFLELDDPIEEIKKYLQCKNGMFVVGEEIIDIYEYCEVNGIANKNSIISVTSKYNKKYHGGSVIIYKHINSFTEEIDFELGYRLVKKTRFINDENKQKLFEVSKTETINSHDFNKNNKNYKNIVICDFGHGLIEPGTLAWNMLSEDQWNVMSQKKYNLMAQTNSMNYGYNTLRKYEKLRGLKLNLICLDMREASLYCDHRNPSDEFVLEKISNTFNVNYIMLTKGMDGIVLWQKKYNGYDKHSIPAIGKNYNKTIDPIGCGDAAYSIASIMLSHNIPNIKLTLFCSAIAGLMHSQVIGNEIPIYYNSFIETCKLFL